MVDRFPLVGVEYGIILVDGRVFGPGGHWNVTLILDTAASITMLSALALEQVGVDLTRSAERRRVDTLAGPIVESIVKVPRLRVLGQEQSLVEVVTTDRSLPFRVDGVLGLNFLRQYCLCLDFPNNWLELVRP